MRSPASEGSDKDRLMYKEVRITSMKAATAEVPTSKICSKKKKRKKEKMGSQHGKLFYCDLLKHYA